MKAVLNIRKNILAIQLFAFLHAVVSMACGIIGIADDLMLTLLTMLMVVIISLRQQVGVVFMTLAVILANIIGLAVGKGLPLLFEVFSLSPLIVHPISTFLCTEILGCLTEICANLYKTRRSSLQIDGIKGLRWLLAVFVCIILLRMLLIIFTTNPNLRIENFRIEMLLDYFFSCIAIVGVSEYAIRTREMQRKASEEASLASYKYMKLKQQVNPHFLFNTLNVLDYLIQEHPREEASRYTHKLAEIYRYMIKNENENTVRLRDELEFVDKYVSLMKVRFAQGFDVRVRVSEEELSRYVVPCSVQMLIENATKHNSVSEDRPLLIDIRTTRNSVVVTNNINPRISHSESTGFGIRYLREQYKNQSGRPVIVKQGTDNFTVILPLL